MPIEPVPHVGAARPVGAIDARFVRETAGERPQSTTPGEAAPLVSTSDALDPGEAPVDLDRVSAVRKAVESGTYPLVPMKVADAIIAAGMLLRSPR